MRRVRAFFLLLPLGLACRDRDRAIERREERAIASEGAPERALAASVDAQLSATGFDELEVVVRDGVVVVSGPVAFARHDEALEIARLAAPSFRIDDETVVH